MIAAITLGLLVGPYRVLSLVFLVVVMTVAVYVRRWGPRGFAWGMVAFNGAFLGFFLHAQIGLGDVGWLAADLAIGVLASLLVRFAFFRPHPERTLARMRRSWESRVRRLLTLSAAVLAEDDERRLPRAAGAAAPAAGAAERVDPHDRRPARRLPAADGRGGGPAALRRRARALQLRPVRRRAGRHAAPTPRSAVTPPRRFAALLAGDRPRLLGRGGRPARRRRPAARGRPCSPPGWPPRSSSTRRPASASTGRSPTTRSPPPARTSSAPRSQLFNGFLPGSMPVSAEASTTRGRGGLLDRATMPPYVRTTIQIAVAGTLAVVAGNALSGRRLYWAVLAVFLCFIAATNSGEQVRRALFRAGGTAIGIVVGDLLVHLTGGHVWSSLLIVLVALFFGIYLIRVNYMFMTIGITVTMAQLYVQLGRVQLVAAAAAAGARRPSASPRWS